MRTAHYWKPAGACTAPSSIIVYDCETWHGDSTVSGDVELQRLRLGCAVAYRLERGRMTRREEITFRSAGEFWRFVEGRLDKKRVLYIFAHNHPYDFGCVSGWKRLIGHQIEPKKVITSGGIFHIEGLINNCPVYLCDTGNYFHCGVKAMGQSLGIPKLPMPTLDDRDSYWEEYCRRDVDITAAALNALIEFHRAGELGPWQPTIASLAFGAFRSRFMRHNVLVHTDEVALKRERRAYYGGIVDTPVIGRRIGGPIYECDVVSMYPSVCHQPLPTRIAGKRGPCDTSTLQGLMTEWFVIADVAIKTTRTTWPVRHRNGVHYPTGEYETTLAHPELELALEHGVVAKVNGATLYNQMPIFREYMGHFVEHKERYKKAGNDMFSTLCKYYANSLYGKTGQLSPRWMQWGVEAMQTLEQANKLPPGTLYDYYEWVPDLYQSTEHVLIPEIGRPVEVRDLYGVTEVRVGEWESRDSCPAIAAAVTSYARCLLRRYQQTAGNDHWFYSDTDSVWVDSVGLSNLRDAGHVAPGELGKLDVKGEHEWLIVHGRKDYETNRVKRMKGIRATAQVLDDGSFMQLEFPGSDQQVRDIMDEGVKVRRRIKRLKREITHCRVNPDGYTTPLVYPSDRPE